MGECVHMKRFRVMRFLLTLNPGLTAWDIMAVIGFAPKAARRGFARTVAASIVAINLCQIGRFLMARNHQN